MLAFQVTKLMLMLLVVGAASRAQFYCTPLDACWPSDADWQTLYEALGGKLFGVSASMYQQCSSIPTSNTAAWTLLENGVCMQHHDCAHEACNSKEEWNLPAYVVQAETEADISIALGFANRNNISVSIKTSGHSYSGSSTMKGSLQIWMRHFKKYSDVGPFTDSCGSTTASTLKVGGGQVWHEAYNNVGARYNLIGGGGKTVSAAGGWLQGGGLSAMSPSYGLGIDNVLQFEVVLANGSSELVDACSNADLFWALRGGGGGTFGVVTAVRYRLHPVTPAVRLLSFVDLNVADWMPEDWKKERSDALKAWMHKWVDLQQGSGLDSRWGGYWQIAPGFGILYFLGNEADAMRTLITDLYAWKDALPRKVGKWIDFVVEQSTSYFDANGHAALETDPGSHKTWDVGSRLIPRSFVLKNGGAEAKNLFSQMVENGYTFTMYQLGGEVSRVSVNATAIHPVMRSAQWSLIGSRETISLVRDSIAGSAACYNHHQKDEPDWQDAFWGSHMTRLLEIKQKFDPDNRFNCYHCVGYKYLGEGEMLPEQPRDCTNASACPWESREWISSASHWRIEQPLIALVIFVIAFVSIPYAQLP